MSVETEAIAPGTFAVQPRGATPTADWLAEFERVLAFRYVILALMTAAAAVVAGGRGDWNVFVAAGRAMVGHDGFAVFLHHQDIQTGPLSLLAAWVLSITPRNGFFVQVILSGVLGMVAIRAAEQSVQFDPSTDPTTARKAHIKTLIGGLVVLFWWAKLGGYGHLDDAAVLAAAAVGLRQVRCGRPLRAAVIIGLSIAVKPWAVIFLPITLVQPSAADPRRRRDRVAPLLAGLAVGAVPWAPFFIAEPATLHSIKATVKVAADSVIQLFGYTDANLPAWLRIAQLGGALALGLMVALRRGPAGVLLAVIAVRMATDPGTWSYYTAGFVLAALIWDHCESAASIPWATLVASVLLLPPWIDPAPEARAILRLVACVGAIVLTVSGRVRPAGRSRPNPDRPAIG